MPKIEFLIKAEVENGVLKIQLGDFFLEAKLPEKMDDVETFVEMVLATIKANFNCKER